MCILSAKGLYRWSQCSSYGTLCHAFYMLHWWRRAVPEMHCDALIREKRGIIVRELSEILNISDSSVKTIIKQHLQYSKVCARRSPRLLTDKHKSIRLQVVQSLLRYEQEGDFFFILSWQWTRCGCITSCLRENVLQCSGVTHGLRNPKKRKPTFSAGKVMATIFWDSIGVLYVDFLPEHRTINTEYYSALLEGPVKTAIRKKRKRAQTSLSFL